MGKFYAVMAGEYEEYHLLTICTIKEKAEEIASFFNADDEENEAHVIELESWDNWSAEKSVYRVSFYDDYRLNRCYLCENMKDELTDNDTEIKENNCWWEKYSVFVCAESREQAIKSARDKLTEYKAREFGLNGKVVNIC